LTVVFLALFDLLHVIALTETTMMIAVEIVIETEIGTEIETGIENEIEIARRIGTVREVTPVELLQ